jgi:hypothetical protein
MFKKGLNVFIPIFISIIFLLPVHQTLGVTSSSTKTTTTISTSTETNPNTEPTSPKKDKQIEDIKIIIGKNTPSFLSKPIIWLVNFLENFRLNYFSSPFIFYGFFFVLVFWLARYIWRFFF